MTEAEVVAFRATGFACPLVMMPREEMELRRGELARISSEPSPLFLTADQDKWRCFRNRHLDSLAVLELACHPAVLGAVSAILGPDLLLWRTDFFIQGKTDPETSWHQDRQFSGPRRIPSLVIPDATGAPVPALPEGEMRGHVPIPASVSAWLAIGDTDRSTGCVVVVEGSNQVGVIPVRPVRPGEKQIFGKGTVLDYEIPEDRVRHMELKAGEFFLFDRLTLHASVATSSSTPRMGLSLRYTTPDVLVYPGATIDGQGFSTDEYRALLVHGEDRRGLNQAVLERADVRRASLAR